MWQLVAGGVTLRDQINERWPRRDKASDGSVGDTSHAARVSDHNPDAQGWVHAIDVDEDLSTRKADSAWLADQLLAYARRNLAGSKRLKNIVYENRVASGTYASRYWTWRYDSSLGHDKHIHISFTDEAERNGAKFPLPIFDGVRCWDLVVPEYDNIILSRSKNLKTKATWRLACRLKELGFYTGDVLPEGEQGFPFKAVTAMQDWMGWEVKPYNAKIHKALWKI